MLIKYGLKAFPMEGHRGQAGEQISLAGLYESTPAKLLAQIKIEATRAFKWLVERITGSGMIKLEDVIRQCPKAVDAMQRDANIPNIVIGMLNEGAKASNIVLLPASGRQMAYRRWVSSGEAGRLQGYDHSTTEAGEPLEDPTLILKVLVDDAGNIWGIYMLPSQLGPGAKSGELPRALCKPTTADGEVDALYSIVGSLNAMAPNYSLWRLCGSGSDANIFACLVRLALRCG